MEGRRALLTDNANRAFCATTNRKASGTLPETVNVAGEVQYLLSFAYGSTHLNT